MTELYFRWLEKACAGQPSIESLARRFMSEFGLSPNQAADIVFAWLSSRRQSKFGQQSKVQR